MSNSTIVTMDKIQSLAKRRGFIFPSSEIYGGLSSAWDYGPLGVELKRNLQEAWWRNMIQYREDVVGLDASIMMHPKVWEASGHAENFIDPMVDCKECHSRFRADQIDLNAPCPVCGKKGCFTEPRQFNLMFKTQMGAVESEALPIFLRPETAQGIFVNFKNVLDTSRKKIPFGIAQVGKAFRNEIVTKNFIFRTCEFEQMEMQFFVKPGEDDPWFNFWKEHRYSFYKTLGINPDKMRFHAHEKDELAHYAKSAFDIEYEFPFGWQEVEGIHNRSDFDLNRHMEASGKDILQYLDPQTGEKYTPYVVETSAGLTRALLMMLCDSYEEEEIKEGDVRTVLKLHPYLAPIKIAFMPLVKKDSLDELAQSIRKEHKKEFKSDYDQSGAIGRRYRRQDEVGTPFCVTIDYQTKEDGTVTVRHRDDMRQVRIHRDELSHYIRSSMATYERQFN